MKLKYHQIRACTYVRRIMQGEGNKSQVQDRPSSFGRSLPG